MDYVMVTDWEEVDPNDFYLSKEWEESKGQRKKLKKMAEEHKLFIGYVVSAQNYVIYSQMDAHQIFIDEDGTELLSCESVVIGNDHEHREAYNM